MARAPETPLLLWVCAAVCAHYMFAEGGGVVAEIHDDGSFIHGLALQARGRVREAEQTFEVVTDNPAADAVELAPEAKKPEPKKPEPEPEAKKDPEAPPEPKKPEEEKKLKLVVEPEDPAKKLAAPPKSDQRIAVQQHVKPDQQDNPDAKFVGDQANKVQEETVATQTSHDQDDPLPTPGGNHAGDPSRVGDSDKTKIADSEDNPGEKNRAPGDKGTEFEVLPHSRADTQPKVASAEPPSKAPPLSGGDGRTAAQPTPAPPEQAQGGAQATAPDVAAENGMWSFNPVQPGSGAEPAPGMGQSSVTPRPRAGSTKWLGLGGRPGPGQINLNLTQQGVVAAVGREEIQRMRVADGERRKSEHRGSWRSSSLERWRSAIENYVSSVKPGNQTSLNTAAVPFASYLVSIHNRIHPIFADSFLGSLGSLPGTHPLNNPRLVTHLEIVVSKEGRLVKMGIVRTSGVTAFDVAALDAVDRASPFGPPPSAIMSPDGNVYLHWEFHRDEVFACSTMNARPFLLSKPPPSQKPEPSPPPAGPKPGQERGAPPPVNLQDTRQGSLVPPLAPLAPIAAGG